MHNVSALGRDGLVMQYGYVMSHRIRDTYMTAPSYVGNDLLSRHIKVVWKKRRAATPYGFGVDLSTLSKRQVAILVALGLSKS
jgi:hypothetical protein